MASERIIVSGNHLSIWTDGYHLPWKIKQGRFVEALGLYESLCAGANPLGLLPEQIDPSSGTFLGNYPQAFSHIGVIASGVGLERACRERNVP